MPKLMVVCVQFHTCILVPDGADATAPLQEAKESVLATIRAGGLEPHDAFAMEPKHERDLPFDWKDQEPFVAATIDDAAFAAYAQTADGQNLNTLEIFKSLYTKERL